MKAALKLLILFLCFINFTFASQINILYDSTSNGKVDPNSEWIVNMIKEAGEKNNIKVNFQGAPWSRALELLKDGIADGLINASYKESRAKFAVYPMKDGKLDLSKSLKAPAYYLYKRKDNPLSFDGRKLINANGKIGAIKSYAVVDDLKKLNANIAYSTNVTSNLNSVLYGSFIATAQLEAEASRIINNNLDMQKELEKLPIAVRKKEYFLIISKPYYKHNKITVEKLWNSIEKLKNSKKYLEQRK